MPECTYVDILRNASVAEDKLHPVDVTFLASSCASFLRQLLTTKYMLACLVPPKRASAYQAPRCHIPGTTVILTGQGFRTTAPPNTSLHSHVNKLVGMRMSKRLVLLLRPSYPSIWLVKRGKTDSGSRTYRLQDAKNM